MFNQLTSHTLRVGIVALLLASFSLALGQTEWTLASKFPASSLQGQYYQVFADTVEELSGGDFTIEIYPSETIGATEAVLDQLQAGIVNLYPEGIGYLERFHAPFAVFELPFIFESPEHWVRFFESEMVDSWRAELRKRNIDALELQVLDPYRVMLTTKPVESLKDLQGLNLRMFPNERVVGVWQHLGANVRVIPWTDVYESLRTGVVEGVTGGVAGVYDMSFHEPAPYILRTEEYPQGVAWMMHRPSYDALTDEQRQILDTALDEAAEWVENTYAEATETRIRDQVASHDVRYLRMNMEDWRTKAAEYYQQLEQSGKLPDGIIEYIQSVQ